MGRLAFVRRHRARIASGLALTLATGAVVTYAVLAEGYESHEAELNDGGVWVVNGERGWSGRINKPINQLDGIVAGDDAKLRMDILQDGAAVVALNLDSGRGQAIQTARLTNVDGGSATVPVEGDLAMAGGTLASTDPKDGAVWAVRYDATTGRPLMSAIDRNSEPVTEVGSDSVLTVSHSGVAVAVSAAESTVTVLRPSGSAFADPEESALGAGAGEPTQVTTVGETIVTLDSGDGILQVVGGPSVQVPEGSQLQQSGPGADSVLVGSPESLAAVDLESGEVTTVAESSGKPAAPVRLGACTFGAWSGGSGSVAVQCGSSEVSVESLNGKASDLVFRVNRNEIVLNDSLSGSVWDVQQDKPIKIDTWESFTSRKKKKDEQKKDEQQSNADSRPPKARPDTYGIRQGRATVIHPLDNDSAPEGRILSIVDVDTPSNGATVEISPDGQTLVVSLPERARSTSFEYHINDGRSGLGAHAPVTVNVRGEGVNAAPEPRQGYEPPSFHLANGGSLSVAVLADWRDDTDGDSLLLEGVELASPQPGVTARTTSDGRIRLTSAPLEDAPARTVRVNYKVSDGRAPAVQQHLEFQVQGAKDESTHPPTAQPDVVRGEVGKPIKVRPLLNDLPGSDPTTRHAELSIAGPLPGQPGVDVRTDREGGTITVKAERAGTYFFDYEAAFGGAPLDRGAIRVDVRPRQQRDGEPVAMPDTLAIFGQAPGMVDVLANDLDPAGSVLVVQRAVTTGNGDLDVAVIDGRWLRISARRPDLPRTSQVVTYTVSNGTHVARGEVAVNQRPEPEDNTPVTTPDHAVVRAGSSVAVPVLDNDISPSGDRLTLVTDVAEGKPGELRVIAPVDVQGDRGKAFVSGRILRYVAPAGLAQRETFEIPYVAQNAAGDTAEGRARITVVPDDADNSPPEPPTLEGRVGAGDTVKVRLPGVGVDPEGDPVTVVGITSAPRLGRISAFGGNYLEYRAYPRTTGTDEFTYAITDGRGEVATGTARIAVVPHGEPQPPLAVADRLTVKPGRTATFDPLANDFIAPGDQVRVELVDAPSGVTLDAETNLVTAKAPADASDRALQMVYLITNGLTSSRSTMTLDVDPTYNNPPVVYDSFGRAEDSGAVEVDVLEGARDPDGSVDDLNVVEVLGDATGTRIEGSTITVNREEDPRVVPFRVEDADGGSATASVYVPPLGDALPHVRPDAMISLDVDGSRKVSLSDYVEAPGGADLRIVEGNGSLAGSPSTLTVTRDGEGIKVSSAGGYRGPAAALVEVTTATDAAGNDNQTSAEDGATALVSIPVQVGDDVPELTCPDTTIQLSTGQDLELDLATLCQVWTVDPRDAAGLDYSASWASGIDGVEVGDPSGSMVDLTVSADANEGGEAVLDVKAGDSNTAQLRFRLTSAPSPTMLPVQVEQMEAGETRTINLAPYLEPGVANPDPRVLSISPIGSTAVRGSASGSSVTLRAPDGARGRATFRVRMTDVASADPPAGRIAEGRLQFEVGGLPGKPSAPQIYRAEESSRVDMDWLRPSDDGGAPITHYVLEAIGTNLSRVCRTTRCSMGGLKTDKNYRFRVRAVNKIGAGEWSEPSQVAVAVTRPGRVRNITLLSQGDHTVTIGWDKPKIGAERLVEYDVRWGEKQATVGASTRTLAVPDLNNNRTHSFRIRVRNEAGEVSDWQESEPFWPLGTPAAPTGLRATDNQSGSVETSVRLDWSSTLPEGEGPTKYTVSYSNGKESGDVPGCIDLVALRCMHAGVPYDGKTYSYTVHASNAGQKRSPASAPATFDAVGRPAEWGTWKATPTGDDQKFRVEATIPAPRGSSADFSVLVNNVVQGTQRVREGQTINAVFDTPNNSVAHNVQLRLCNENVANGCTLSAAKPVHTLGPFTDAHLVVGAPEASGTTVSWQVSGDTNGPSGELSWSLSTGQTGVLALPPQRPKSTFSVPITADAKSYETDVKLTVTLGDDPGGRRPLTKHFSGKTGETPAPTIVVSKGTPCSDAPGSTRIDCNRGADLTTCNKDSCAKIHLEIRGFDLWGDSTKCWVHGHSDSWFLTELETMTTANPSRDLGWYSPHGNFEIRCNYASGTAVVSDAPDAWP